MPVFALYIYHICIVYLSVFVLPIMHDAWSESDKENALQTPRCSIHAPALQEWEAAASCLLGQYAVYYTAMDA